MFLDISQNSQENSCAQVFFKKVAGEACNFIKKDSGTGVFLWIAKFLKTPFLQSTSRQLLLQSIHYLETTQLVYFANQLTSFYMKGKPYW